VAPRLPGCRARTRGQRGCRSFAAQDWQTAIFFLERAIKKDPLDHRAFLLRSELKQKLLRLVPAPSRDEVMVAAGQAQKDAETALELIAAREHVFEQRTWDPVALVIGSGKP
jgi:Tfp pilus assembly protein PilF